MNAHRAHGEDGEPLIVLTVHDNTEIEFARGYPDKLVGALRDPFLVLDWICARENREWCFLPGTGSHQPKPRDI